MAEAAGLALSAVSIASIFTTCIQCFDIVVGAKNSSINYELLSAQLELEHLRFLIWGQSVGLTSAPNSNDRQERNQGLDQPHVQSVVTKQLLCIKYLLDEAAKLNTRYATNDDDTNTMVRTGAGSKSRLFEHTYSRFKRRVQENQKQSSPWKVTRWTLHDQQSFENTVQSLRTFVDGLEKITTSLEGVYKRQQRILRDEVEHMSDIESLNLVHDASAASDRISPSASHRLLSEAASQRLGSIRSILQEGEASSLVISSRLTTCASAPTIQSQEQNHNAQEQYQSDSEAERTTMQQLMPQNQRLFHAHQTKGGKKMQDLSTLFSGLETSGQVLARTRHEDLEQIKSTLTGKETFSPLIRLMCRRLKEFISDPIPFISIAPINGNILNLLASVEGPPGSPYEGGVFYIWMVIPDNFPFKPPACKFITKIYHPNVDSVGNICLEGLSLRWDPSYGRLEKLLLAICALLDDPCVEDPLVPEIAETFMRDRNLFDRNARQFTASYARGRRPRNLPDFPTSASRQGFEDTVVSYTPGSVFGTTHLNSLPFPGIVFRDVDSFEKHPSIALDLSRAIALDALGYRFPKHQNAVFALASLRNLPRAWVELLFSVHKFLTLSVVRNRTRISRKPGPAPAPQEIQLVVLCCQQMLLHDDAAEIVPGTLPGDSLCLSYYLSTWFIRRTPQKNLAIAWDYTSSNDSRDQEQFIRELEDELSFLSRDCDTVLDKETKYEEIWIAIRFSEVIRRAGPHEQIFHEWVKVIESDIDETYQFFRDSFLKRYFEAMSLDHHQRVVQFNLRSLTLLVWDLIEELEG